MKTQENKLIVGAVVSTRTTGQEDIKQLQQERNISVENCPEIPAQPVIVMVGRRTGMTYL